jgi:prophage antirepressor-like protein
LKDFKFYIYYVYITKKEKMMNNLMKFSYNNSDVRVMDQNGEPWFLATDLCDVLGVKNGPSAISRLDPVDVSTIVLNDSALGGPPRTIVNESGMYELVLSSRKKEARQFKRWITHEVLPALSKDGIYITDKKASEIENDKEAQDLLLSRALEVAAKRMEEAENKNRMLEKDNRVLTAQNNMLEIVKEGQKEQIKSMERVCEYADDFINTDGLVTFTDLGNQVGLSGRKMREWMQEEGIVARKKQNGHWTLRKPYSENRSLYKIDYYDQDMDDGSTKRRYLLKFTPAGAMLFTMKRKEWKAALERALSRV